MLIPSKHSHPDDTVLAAATRLLTSLQRFRIVSYDDLRTRLLDRDGADYLFLPSLSLLYLLGLIEYRATVDSFEYVGGK